MRSILNRLEKLERRIDRPSKPGHCVFMHGCADEAKNRAALRSHGVDLDNPHNIIFNTLYETEDGGIEHKEPVITMCEVRTW